jgi:hypothetical protein
VTERDIRGNVRALVETLSKMAEEGPVLSVALLGELLAQLLVDHHRIANALETMARNQHSPELSSGGGAGPPATSTTTQRSD